MASEAEESATSRTEMGQVRVRFNGKFYDVSDFVDKHPGGVEVFWKCFETNVDDIMKGEVGVDGLKHKHSEAALRLLETMPHGSSHSARKMVQNGSVDGSGLRDSSSLAGEEADPIDYSRGALSQVGSLGENYWHWIHRPLNRPVRLFDSDFLEFFSKQHWSTVPIVWLPVAIYFLFISLCTNASVGLYDAERRPIAVGVWFVGGVAAWTFIEYALHRFVFHFRPPSKSPKLIALHFVLHGMHHKTPFDKSRLVFPVAPAAIVVGAALGLYSAFSVTFFGHQWGAFAMAAGSLIGYVCYDLIHYYLHHGTPKRSSYWHSLKVYHCAHHFKDWNKGFGISTRFWDRPFGTLAPTG